MHKKRMKMPFNSQVMLPIYRILINKNVEIK